MEYKGYKGIKPETDTIKKWLFTRKRSADEFLTIGDYKFSGIYTTQNFKSDAVFFWIALICEIGFLVAVSIMVGGFDILLSLSALVCVVLDFIGAFFYHKNENEICKAQLKLNIERYKMNTKQGSTSDEVNIKIDTIELLKKEPARTLGISLIIVSAILKILGSAVLFEMPVFTIVLTVIYCFVAWIHIKKTGFYFSGRKFFKAMDRELNKHIKNGSNDSIKKLDQESDFEPWEVENIPTNVELKEIKMHIFSDTKIYDSLQKKNDKWLYRKWKHHFWDDGDLQKFINSKDDNNDVLSDSAKAFIAADITERRFLNIKD
jgi:hypothetical protein